MSSDAIAIDDKTASRRKAKRLIPDSEKDERYWVKRHKNNAAAKRSRENKRQMDSVLKSKVHNLEEENMLLRRELSLLKEHFKIPTTRSFLSPKEQARAEELMVEKQYLVQEVTDFDRNNLITTVKQEPSFESDTNHNNAGSLLLLSRLSTWERAGYEFMEQTGESFNGDRLFRYSQKDLGTPPKAHSPSASYQKYGVRGNSEELRPADLSINKHNQNHNTDKLSVLSRLASDRNYDNCDRNRSADSEKSDCSDSLDESLNKDPDQFGYELKEKLQKLSDQVLKMQKLVHMGNS